MTIKVLRASELVEKTYTEPPVVVDGGVLDYAGFTLLTGQGGVGKSLLALQLATQVARGQPFLGFAVPYARPVLLVQKELTPATLQARLRAQLVDTAAPPDFYIVENPGDIQLSASGGSSLIDVLVKDLGVGVLILDPLVEFHSVDENSNSQLAQVVLPPVRRWQSQGCSVLIVHHHNKPSDEHPRKGGDRVRGGSALFNALDTNIQLLSINPDLGYYNLEFAKLRNHANRPPLALWRDSTTQYHLRGSDHIIVDAVKAQGGEVTVPDLVAWACSTTGMDRSTAYRTIDRVVASGRLERTFGAMTSAGRSPDKVKVKSEESGPK